MTAIIITAIICLTLIIITLGSNNRGGKNNPDVK